MEIKSTPIIVEVFFSIKSMSYTMFCIFLASL